MKLKTHVCQMADYNQWMNQKIYEAVGKLSPEQLLENKGAFFGSILGTLNHIAVADTIWLKRFAPALPKYDVLNAVVELSLPASLDTMLFNNLQELKDRRQLLDETFSTLANSLSEEELLLVIHYKNMKGIASSKNLFSLLMHVFNHQTHHRGQVTTLLSQSGVDVGITDLVFILPNEN
jgi:uncharacterized damage-inducible protein DinB